MRPLAILLLAAATGTAWADVSSRGRSLRPTELGLARSVPLKSMPLGSALSPDGRWLALGCTGSVVRVFDTLTWKEAHNLKALDQSTWSVAFKPDGKFLAAGGDNGSIQLFDTTVWTEMTGFTAVRPVLSLSWSPNGTRLAAATDQGVRVWDADSLKDAFTLAGSFTSAAWDPTGRKIATTQPESVRLWDAKDGRETQALKAEGTPFLRVAFDRGGKRLAALAADGTVILWDAATGRQEWMAKGTAGSYGRLDFAPDGRLVIAAAGSVVEVWDAGTGKPLATLKHHAFDICALTVAPGSAWIATGGADLQLKIWKPIPGGMSRVRPPGFLGIKSESRPDGVVVLEVIKDTPAEQAGLRRGDLVIEIAGALVTTREDLSGQIASHCEGDEIDLTVLRGGKEVKARAKLTARPADPRR